VFGELRPWIAAIAKAQLNIRVLMFQLQVAVTSEPGEGHIIAFRDYDKKFSSHVVSLHISCIKHNIF
jgi:hypothetical protein